jgi:hypothetical protein
MGESPRRALTEGEVKLASAAFGEIDYGRVRLCAGAGGNSIAAIAFRSPNVDAITLIRTIFFRDKLVPDFSLGGEADLFMHEMTHIWQYQTMSLLAFGWRYMDEFERCNFNRDCLYHYDRGITPFREAKLEAQAQIVQDFHLARAREDPDAIAALRLNLAGSGFHDL